MKNSSIRTALVLAGACTLLGGCSWISGLFPDKQKQYKYSAEVPPLEIPPDLTGSTIEGIGNRASGEEPAAPATGEASAAGLAAGAAGAGAAAAAGSGEYTPAPASAAPASPAAGGPTLAQSSDNVPLIEIEAPFDTAWVEVSKALGRLEVEVSDQNRGDGTFYVYYGGAAGQKPKEDKGFFGDMADLFSGGGGKHQEYRVKLESRPKFTVVTVLDSENKPQTDGNGLELLKKINETLSTMPSGAPAP